MKVSTESRTFKTQFASARNLGGAALVFFILMSCEEETENLGFQTQTGTGVEGSGTQRIVIDLGSALSTDVTISYRVGGTAALNGDYSLSSGDIFYSSTDASSYTYTLVAKKGASTAAIEFEIIDDAYIEKRDESIYFEITAISNSDLYSKFQHIQYEFRIEDNDTSPTDGLQVDLAWQVGDGVSIYAANFDLYLARNVELDNEGTVTSFEMVETLKSTNAKGFESFIINKELENEEYYVFIRYVSGSSDANIYLTMSQGSDSGTASGSVNASFIGKDLYYGPITKEGNDFRFR